MQKNENVKSHYSNHECEDCLSRDRCIFSQCEFHVYHCIGYISRRKINNDIYNELLREINNAK